MFIRLYKNKRIIIMFWAIYELLKKTDLILKRKLIKIRII